MGDIYWDCPSIDFTKQNKTFVVSSLIQAGLKLFFHQRNQIPLPLEQLNRSRSCKSATDGTNGLISQSDVPSCIDDEEEVEPRVRIQAMLAKRKRLNNLKRGLKIGEKSSKQELSAFETISVVLETFNSISTKLHSSLKGVALIFGQSLYSPKEVILFDLSRIELYQPQSTASLSFNEEIVPLLRNFYKKIIMSDPFVDLTEKNLNSMQSHICVFTQTELPEENQMGLLLIEEIQWLQKLFETSSSDKSSTSFHDTSITLSRQTKNARKILRVILTDNEDGDDLNNTTSSSIGFHHDKDDNKEFICKINSFCYQIPFRFKGLHYKKKGLL